MEFSSTIFNQSTRSASCYNCYCFSYYSSVVIKVCSKSFFRENVTSFTYYSVRSFLHQSEPLCDHTVGCKNCSKKIRFVRCSDRAAKFSFSQNFVTIFTSSRSYLFSSQPIDKILSKLKLIPLILILKKKE